MPSALGIAVVDRGVCEACGLCMPLCPPGAITMHRDGLVVDAVTCTGCRKCIDPCPVGALAMEREKEERVTTARPSASASA